jgi:hypothetical protein
MGTFPLPGLASRVPIPFQFHHTPLSLASLLLLCRLLHAQFPSLLSTSVSKGRFLYVRRRRAVFGDVFGEVDVVRRVPVMSQRLMIFHTFHVSRPPTVAWLYDVIFLARLVAKKSSLIAF